MTLYEASGSSISIPQKEVFRYLGYRGISPDNAVLSRISDCVRTLMRESRPRSVWARYPLALSAPGEPSAKAQAPADEISIPGLRFSSRQLAKNLQGCSCVVLMAATIGLGADFLIRRAEAISMVDAAIYQAAGAAMAEAWCDEVNRRIISVMKEQSLFPRPRFSPGYGDVPLSLQKDFSALLQMPSTCGISLTDTLLMVPGKSVTAFIGFSEKPQPCILEGCEACSNQNHCAYRR